ncbi:hypothetical protein [Streptomyces sp. NPDC047525]|uniref:hypothetical protein n=1 Tax=Streptomyces sp. NPDC047525 TaxID=3155264 RepID=UPI0033C1E4C7
MNADRVLTARNAAHFGAAASYGSWDHADSAATALEQPETRLDVVIHHLSEVCLLRDLYPHTHPATNGAVR